MLLSPSVRSFLDILHVDFDVFHCCLIFKKMFNVNLLPLVDLLVNFVLRSPFNLVVGFSFQRNSFSTKHILSVL